MAYGTLYDEEAMHVYNSHPHPLNPTLTLALTLALTFIVILIRQHPIPHPNPNSTSQSCASEAYSTTDTAAMMSEIVRLIHSRHSGHTLIDANKNSR